MITLQTKNPVTHIDVDNLVVGGTLSTQVKLIVGAYALVVTPTENGVSERIEVAYEYRDGNDNALPTSDNNTFRIIEGLKATSQGINGSLPADDNIVDRLANEVEAMAKIKLAERFGIDVADINVL
jgi:hypothetical protein